MYPLEGIRAVRQVLGGERRSSPPEKSFSLKNKGGLSLSPRKCSIFVTLVLEGVPCPLRRSSSSQTLPCQTFETLMLLVAERVQAAAEATTADDVRVEEIMDSLKWDSSSGLLVAIAQNADTGDVMMQGFADRRAVAKTLLTGRATFFSRSRK